MKHDDHISRAVQSFLKAFQNRQSDLPDENFDAKLFQKIELETKRPSYQLMRLIKSHSLFVLIVFLLMAGMISGAVLLKIKDTPTAQIINGDVSVGTADVELHQLEPQETLKESQRIETGPGEWVILDLGKGCRIKIEPGSQLLIEKLKPKFLPGAAVFHLAQGRVFVHIGDTPDQKYPLEIRTVNTFAKAIGTQFAVSAPTHINPRSIVAVLRGQVQVGAILNEQRLIKTAVPVSKGQKVYVSSESKSISPTQIIKSERDMLEGLFQFGKRNQIVLLLSLSSNRVHELLKPCQIYIRFDLKNENLKQLASVASEIRGAIRAKDPWKHQIAAKNFERAIETQDELDIAAGLLFVAAYSAVVGQDEEAVRIFEKIYRKYPNSPYRSLAMMAAAKIYLEKLNDPARALELSRAVLKEHPMSLEKSYAQELLDLILALNPAQ